MEQYKIINGKRHYWDESTRSWKIDNRTQAQAEADWAKAVERTNRQTRVEEGWIDSLLQEPKPVSYSSTNTRGVSRSGKSSRRKKKKTINKPLIFVAFCIGMILGYICNYFYVSSEELYIKEYMENFIREEGEINESD